MENWYLFGNSPPSVRSNILAIDNVSFCKAFVTSRLIGNLKA